jgi:alkylation response protein AidB-like acyl-CoA dehydrogenase
VLADVSEGHKNIVFFDDVRVPADCLVGGENNGWRVANTHLELEHGMIGALRGDPLWERLFAYCRTEQRDGKPLITDPDVRDQLADMYAKTEVLRLLNTRNFWRSYEKQKQPYNGPQLTYLRKVTGLAFTKAVLDTIGPAALTDDPTWGALDGHAQHQQREGIVFVIPGGTIDVQRVVMARALGLGRKPRVRSERPAKDA